MPTKKTTKKTAKKAVKSSSKTGQAKKTTAKKTVKKTVKKSTPKKTVKKTSKNTAAKPLVFASNNTSFWVNDGQILNSLVALRDAFDGMDKAVYEYHAKGNDQNDFANWVGVVLCDGDCAAALEKAKTPRSAKTVVVKHLKYYAI
tara:strand:- start:2931 stop:3365 length:435 start_codon:yes stop_codon:yes gene_type:complete